MSRHYLIFERYAHSVVYFVRADTPTEALCRYISEQDSNTAFQQDGSLTASGKRYAHPLAYIEANCKVDGEWQMRGLPDWTWQDDIAEVFCGESADGPPSVIDDCRKQFSQEFPGVRAKALLWYVREGALVTFYREKRSRFTVLRRYLWNWDGINLTVAGWAGSDEQVLEAVAGLQPPRLHRL